MRSVADLIGGLLATAPMAKAEQIGALLTGYEEVPSVSTTASGEFTATISPDGSSAYANVHTAVSPGGEIRGQIRTIAK